MNIVGIMSGSSLDGLDICLCHFSGSDEIKWELIAYTAVSFDEALQNKLSIAHTLDTQSLLVLDSEFAHFCALKVIDFLAPLTHKTAYIGSHGHTVFHHPEKGFSLQIGNPGIIATISGINCVGDFRTNDISIGGQGAPLAPIVERHLFPGFTYYLNLGGIANLSCHLQDKIVSWDVTPCNQVLNYYAEKFGFKYDDRGKIARTGTVNNRLLQSLSTLDFFSIKPPKSLDNQWSKNHFISLVDSFNLSPEDSLNTCVVSIAKIIAQDIASQNTSQKDGQIFVTGGGAFNDYLIEEIDKHLKGMHLHCFVPQPEIVEMKEAALMALMAYLRIIGKPNTIPSVTGASRATCAGAIYLA